MRKPIAFIATDGPEQTAAFYRDVIGLDLVEDTPFALVFDDGGSMLRIQKIAQIEPATHTVHGWQVTDILAEMARLASHGVEFSRYEGLGQDEHGVWTSPDGHKICWFRDPCGNNLSLTQFAG